MHKFKGSAAENCGGGKKRLTPLQRNIIMAVSRGAMFIL